MVDLVSIFTSGLFDPASFWFILSMGINVLFVPLGLYGVKKTLGWIDRNFRKPAQGYIEVRQKMPNDRFRKFWIKPTGQIAKFKNIAGQMIEKPINTKKGWMAFDGNVPMIELDENGNQLQFENLSKAPGQENYAKGQRAAYETGKLLGAVDMFSTLQMLIMLCLIFSVIGMLAGMAGAYYSNKAATNPPIVDNAAIAQAVMAEIKGTTPTANSTVPTA